MTDGAATVLGAGVVAPGGCDAENVWATVLAGAGTRAERIEYSEYGGLTVLGCRADDFDPAQRLARHEVRRLDRTHQMAFLAADDAIEAAGPGPSPDRCAVIVGAGFGAPEFQEAEQRAVVERGIRGVSPLAIPVIMPNSIAAHLSIRHRFTGPSMTITGACASGTMAIGEAMWMLRSGRVDRVLAGGVDAMHTIGVSASFARMEAMSTRLDDPDGSSRPFDHTRDGFVLGEGAAFFVLERSSDSPEGIGRVLGYATNSDAHHIVAPPDDGRGAVACMNLALRDGGLSSGDVGHVNAHGTATKRNDLAEAKAIGSVFGPRGVPTTSTKGVIGHLIGGAGAVEALMTLLALRDGVVPPTANLTAVDHEIEPLLDVVGETRPTTTDIALSNSFGFGGHNATIAITR